MQLNKNADQWISCFVDSDSDDPKVEFIQTWDRVRLPAGMDMLDLANRQAKTLPLKLKISHSEKYERFVSIAGHLQRLRPGLPIFLPEQKLAAILGCRYQTVGWYRAEGVKHGLLKELSKHDYGRRRATEFEFNLDLFDWDSGEQIEPLVTEQQN